MTALIENQLTTAAVMLVCGMTAGLISCSFSRFESRLAELAGFVIAGYMVNLYLYYCDYGKISFTAVTSAAAGMWLWNKWFCGKIED